MFHAVAGATGWFLIPSSCFLLLQLWALWSLWSGKIRRARWLFTFTILALVAVKLPIPGLLIQPLEQSFSAATLPEKIDGIVVLAGAERVRLTRATATPQFSEDSERATEFIALARRYPQARFVFSGQRSECEVFKLFLSSQGFDPRMVTFEPSSRDTYESAINTHSLVQPQPQQLWVLLTSASHMPRAVGAFRKAGWDVVAYPVAYRALPHFAWAQSAAADTLDIAVHEWVGIALYKLAGRM